jgi:hypothetical protein
MKTYRPAIRRQQSVHVCKYLCRTLLHQHVYRPAQLTTDVKETPQS